MTALEWGFVGTLTGTIVGAAASIATSLLNARNSAKLHKQTKAIEREERYRVFQREVIIELQDNLLELNRLYGDILSRDIMSFRKTGEWRKSKIGEDLSEGTAKLTRRIVVLIERIDNDELRADLKKLKEHFGNYHFTQTELAGQESLHQSTTNTINLLEKLGMELRTHY